LCTSGRKAPETQHRLQAKTTRKDHSHGQRFVAGRANFERHYRAAVDAWAIYDNAGDEPVLIEWGEKS